MSVTVASAYLEVKLAKKNRPYQKAQEESLYKQTLLLFFREQKLHTLTLSMAFLWKLNVLELFKLLKSLLLALI